MQQRVAGLRVYYDPELCGIDEQYILLAQILADAIHGPAITEIVWVPKTRSCL